jgi:hypothetical protein
MTSKIGFDALPKPGKMPVDQGSGRGQIAAMQTLTQDAAAWLIGRNPRALRSAMDAPRTAIGKYCARDLVQWLLLKSDSDAALGAGVNSPALEKYRIAKAKLAELELREREGNLIPRVEIHTHLGRLGAILKGCGERLQRDHGAAALEIWNEAIDDFEREIKSQFGDVEKEKKPC